jgi:hypothetical protein
MLRTQRLTAIIEREDDGYVALSRRRYCPPKPIDALTLFFEAASAAEIDRWFQSELFVTQVEVPVG